MSPPTQVDSQLQGSQRKRRVTCVVCRNPFSNSGCTSWECFCETESDFPLLLCGAVTCCISFEQYVRADDSGARPERSTIERGLNFLQQDAVKWRQEKKCSTCHHGTMTMWVQLEAKSRGFAVAPDELEENIRWAKERIMERADLPRDTRAGWSMVNTPAIYLAIMAHAVPRQDAISRMTSSVFPVIYSAIRKKMAHGCGLRAAEERPTTVL